MANIVAAKFSQRQISPLQHCRVNNTKDHSVKPYTDDRSSATEKVSV